MAVFTSQTTVGSAPVPLRVDTARAVTPATGMLVYNRGTTTMYVGPQGVTPTTGFQVDADQRVTIPSASGVYAVTASGSTVAHVLQVDSYA